MSNTRGLVLEANALVHTTGEGGFLKGGPYLDNQILVLIDPGGGALLYKEGPATTTIDRVVVGEGAREPWKSYGCTDIGIVW